jgi:hypothetical protein
MAHLCRQAGRRRARPIPSILFALEQQWSVPRNLAFMAVREGKEMHSELDSNAITPVFIKAESNKMRLGLWKKSPTA